MDTVAVDLARKAMEVIEGYYKKQQTLKFTTFCAMVVQLPNRNNARAVVVASAGKTASGITGKLVDELDAALCAGGGVAIIPCAAPTAGQSNDAEQQAAHVDRK